MHAWWYNYLQRINTQIVHESFSVLMFLPPFLEVRLPRVVVDVALVLSPLNIGAELFLNLD